MPLPSLLLRVLLGLSLIFNGPGFAFASGHMQMGAGQGVSTDGQLQPPCHEDSASSNAATMQHGIVEETAKVAEGPNPADPACCESGSCRCICAIGAVAIVPPALDDLFAPVNGTAIQQLLAVTPAPLLPHQIRPPIG